MNAHTDITDEVPADGRFYAQGEHVRRAPIAHNVEGGTRYEIGFTVCRMSAYVPDAAPILAAALNISLAANEAAIALQDASAWSHQMREYYRKDFEEAEQRAAQYGGDSDWRKTEALANFKIQAAKSARASLAARKLMGIE